MQYIYTSLKPSHQIAYSICYCLSSAVHLVLFFLVWTSFPVCGSCICKTITTHDICISVNSFPYVVCFKMSVRLMILHLVYVYDGLIFDWRISKILAFLAVWQKHIWFEKSSNLYLWIYVLELHSSYSNFTDFYIRSSKFFPFSY